MPTQPICSGLTASRLDHVAIAVPDSRIADQRFANDFGGGLVARGRGFGAYIRQYRFANGHKLEVLAPDRNQEISKRLDAHISEHPASIHHLTLLVESTPDVKAELTQRGIDFVAEAHQPDGSHEIFVRPGDAAGLLVQIASRPLTDVEWARHYGQESIDCRADAASFHGIHQPHPDPAVAGRQLATLGADVKTVAGFVLARWRTGPAVWISDRANDAELFFTGAHPTPSDPALGPATRPPPTRTST